MFGLVAFVFALVASPAFATEGQAAQRIALVIGNSAYQHTPKLTNPKNDATDMVAAFKKHGFQVLEGFDLDKAAFERKVRDFANALQGAEAGVFYFAGHGLQVSGHNYLVPVDAQLATVAALEFEMVRLDVVHRVMERLTNTNVLFLDACRDNPLARNLARAMGTRSSEIGRGLAAVESGVGTLISFSTQPGNVALDGSGRNSPFAGALVKHMSSSSDDLSAILIATRNDVMKDTQRKQVPWEHSALTGRFYFGSAPTPKTVSPPPVAPARVSEAAEAWDRTKDSTSVAALELFMVAYQNTYYAGLARLRIDSLREEEASRVGLAKREAELRKAEEAKRLAEAKQAEEQKRLEETKRSEELTKAREEARRAQEALRAAEAERLAALKAADEARKRAEAATSSVKMANAPQSTEPPSSHQPVTDTKALARSLQTELKRVGCDPGQVDGNWTPKVKAALRDFARITKKSIPTDTPSEAALAVVSGQKSQVCNVRPVEKQPVERQRQAKERTQPQASPSSEPKSSGMECVGMIARDQAAAPWCKK